MKTLVVFALFCLSVSSVQSQNVRRTVLIKNRTAANICWKVETPPLIDSALWVHYLQGNLQPDSLLSRNIPAGIYEVQLVYRIGKNGRFAGADCRNKPGYGLDSLVIKKLATCPLQWAPATINGRPVLSHQFINLQIEVSPSHVRAGPLPWQLGGTLRTDMPRDTRDATLKITSKVYIFGEITPA